MAVATAMGVAYVCSRSFLLRGDNSRHVLGPRADTAAWHADTPPGTGATPQRDRTTCIECIGTRI
eukprot:5916275-Lingulodinium_polyedra.AAC.1